MTHRLLACAAVALLTACHHAAPVAAPTTTAAAPTTPPPATLTPATPSPTAAAPAPVGFGRTVTGDVDGDGRADSVRLVHNQYEQADPRWQWGVVAVLAHGGPVYLWNPPRADSNEAQWLTGVTDMNADGRAEIVVSPGGTAFSDFHDVVVYAGGRLVYATAPGPRRTFFETSRPPAAPAGFGCAETVASSSGREVYGVAARADADGRTYTLTRTDYRLRDATFTVLRTRTARWTTGAPAPAGFGYGVRCGSLRVFSAG
jgi:hypothetical protein